MPIASSRSYSDTVCEDAEPGVLCKGICISYADERRDNELRYMCTLCSRGAHAACSSYNLAENYVCDCCC
jgi:hypothetical protein